MDSEIIQLKGVTKHFKKNVVLENLNLVIPEGQITGIIGASGEGKSTILKLIIGFYKPNKGDILYLRRSVFKNIREIERKFGFSTDEGSFYDNLTVLENVRHFARLHKLKRKEVKKRAGELLDFVGLTYAARTKAKNLSAGMKKRLDVACSLVHNPEVLIMDEPTADLDPLLRAQMLGLVLKIKKQGTTIILTTQLLDEMDKVCDKIAILHEKRIVEEGPPMKIRNKYNASDLNAVFEKIFSRKTKNAPENPKINTQAINEIEEIEKVREETERRERSR